MSRATWLPGLRGAIPGEIGYQVIKSDTLCKKIDDFGCHIAKGYATLKAFGLHTRTGWRTTHPQAATKPRTISIYSPITGAMPVIAHILGAWVGSQRKRPRCAFPLCGTALRLPDPPLCLTHKGSFP